MLVPVPTTVTFEKFIGQIAVTSKIRKGTGRDEEWPLMEKKEVTG